MGTYIEYSSPTTVYAFVVLILVLSISSCSDSSLQTNETSRSTQKSVGKRKVVDYVVARSPNDLAKLDDSVVEVHIPKLDTRYVTKLLQYPWLKRLHVKSGSSLDDGLRRLNEVLELQEIRVESAELSGTGWEELARMQHLQSVSLYGLRDVGRRELRQLASNVNIEEVDLSGSDFTELGAIRELRALPSLGQLTLNKVTGFADESLLYLPLVGCLSLMDNAWITNEGIEHLKRQVRAWSIDLSGCHSLDPSSLAQLSEALPACTIWYGRQVWHARKDAEDHAE